MKLKVIIVDDEKLAREDLKLILANFEEIVIIGEADKLIIAEKLCEELKPDLIFLDIKLKGEIGFELLNKIDKKIKIVFVTAFDEYAVRAFEVNALDYLLKPINPKRLKLTLEKLFENDESEISENRFEIDDSIFIQLNHKHQFIKINQIIAITSASDYSEIITSDYKKHITSKPMREWETRLPEKHFCRIHRSSIINLDFIENVEDWFNHSYTVKLKGIEKSFTMSRNYAARIKKLLS